MAPDPAQFLDLAVAVAHEAGAMLLDGAGRVRTVVETKSTGTDMVTEMDRASERLIADRLQSARPDDAFLGEEGTAGTGTTGVRWVGDPLDGTTNYLYGYPGWAVSIAAELDGQPFLGVVHDPNHAETFTAIAGGGATCNGHRLEVVGAAELATALVGTGFSYDAGERRRQAATLTGVLPFVRDVRRAGSAALDLCWVGRGRLDAYFERGLAPWDRAAGSLVAAEAGATTALLDDGMTVAAAPQLFDPLIRLLAAAP
jgi:myo-inositol-1(or 4)-monophosphatase